MPEFGAVYHGGVPVLRSAPHFELYTLDQVTTCCASLLLCAASTFLVLLLP